MAGGYNKSSDYSGLKNWLLIVMATLAACAVSSAFAVSTANTEEGCYVKCEREWPAHGG